MTFYGYLVGTKFFGCGQRKEAYAYAEKHNLKVIVKAYKF